RFYLALNQTVDPNLTNGIWANVYHSMRSVPANGNVYAFERSNPNPKQARWVAQTANQMLVLERFQDMPVLLCTARYNKFVNNGANRFAQNVVAVKSIDKRTGKLLFDKELPQNANNFHSLQIDLKMGIIDFVSFNLKIRHTLEPEDGQK